MSEMKTEVDKNITETTGDPLQYTKDVIEEIRIRGNMIKYVDENIIDGARSYKDIDNGLSTEKSKKYAKDLKMNVSDVSDKYIKRLNVRLGLNPLGCDNYISIYIDKNRTIEILDIILPKFDPIIINHGLTILERIPIYINGVLEKYTYLFISNEEYVVLWLDIHLNSYFTSEEIVRMGDHHTNHKSKIYTLKSDLEKIVNDINNL